MILGYQKEIGYRTLAFTSRSFVAGAGEIRYSAFCLPGRGQRISFYDSSCSSSGRAGCGSDSGHGKGICYKTFQTLSYEKEIRAGAVNNRKFIEKTRTKDFHSGTGFCFNFILAEVSLQKTLERAAVTSLILSHLMNGGHGLRPG